MLTPVLKLVPILQELLSNLFVASSSSSSSGRLNCKLEVQSLSSPNLSVNFLPTSLFLFKSCFASFFE